ncbi:cyanophycinase [Roseivirga sp.]|uniref:cyanophycinase n=1 Tax=Roseivirga sp. TaxID=1964215 RepID=UPI002B26A539|nr:cyanophycinase [Roseivirga sp.]
MTKLTLTILCALFTFSLFSQTTEGPKNGHLIIAGGALKDANVYAKIIELAGGEGKAHIVVIPTAGGNNVTPEVIQSLENQWKGYGAAKVSVLHTTDPKEANTEAFSKVIDEAGGVYFLGGRQWRLADSYLNTKVHEKLFNLLKRDGVIAGSSAGATIQGSYLARGDTKGSNIMIGDHEVGLGFISNIAIDQHTLARNRQFDMFEILGKYPKLLGVALDENTAMLVSGNEFEVIGQSYIMIYDGTHWDQTSSKYEANAVGEHKFHVLRAGRKYDMAERKVVRGSR